MRFEGNTVVMTGTMTDIDRAPGVPEDHIDEGMVMAIVVENNGANDTMRWLFDDVETTRSAIPVIPGLPVETDNFIILNPSLP